MNNYWLNKDEEIDVIVEYADDLSITKIVKSKVNRRDFLKTAVATTTALVIPIVAVEPTPEPTPKKFLKAVYIGPDEGLKGQEFTIVSKIMPGRSGWCDVVSGEPIAERIYPDWPPTYINAITVEYEYLRII